MIFSSPTLTLPTIQTSHTPIHQHHRLGAALITKHRLLRKRLPLRFPMLGLKFLALFIKKILLVIGHLFRLDHADVLQMRFDRVADFGDQRRHEHAAFFEVAAVRVEYRFHLFDQEAGVAAFAEYRRD